MKIPFMTVELRSYRENNPGGSDYRIDSLRILDGPPDKDSEFVILETILMMAHPPLYQAHFYRSKEEMFAAFRKGMESVLNSPPESEGETTMEEMVGILFTSTKSFFVDHPGFIRTIITDDFGKAPWFLAEDGDTVEGDVALLKKIT